MIRSVVTAVLVALLLLLQYRFWLGDGGVRDHRRLRQQVAAQEQEVLRLKARNAALAAEVADLKSGVAAVEARARADMGMILPNETFYLITPNR